MKKKYVEKEIWDSQAHFSWDVQRIASGGRQGSYYIEKDQFDNLLDDEILIETPEIEHYPEDNDRLDDKLFILNGYDFTLGPEVLEIIGDEYGGCKGFLIARTERWNSRSKQMEVKFQLMKSTFEHLSKYEPGYKWFPKLYDKNISGTKLVIETSKEDDKKIFKLDIEYPNIKELTFKSVPINKINLPHNRIIFGAPGTGKSNELDKDRKKHFDLNYERVTFHPNYSYSQFVGTYKPVQKQDADGKKLDDIIYDYIPGPFLRIYVKAMNNPNKPYLLLIEEINRANVTSVFGDVLQLLDRKNGESEYEIATSRDMEVFLGENIKSEDFCPKRIKIPSNMYIWATMNSADQGVFPVDAAFKRRWDFEYIDIDEKDDCISNIYVTLGNKNGEHKEVNWNDLRKKINEKLIDLNVNEDKLLGPYFLSKKVLGIENDENVPYLKKKNKFKVKDNKKFIEAFKSKVIMYLYEDVVKQNPGSLFENCKSSRYSAICKDFEEIGANIFGDDF